ncbi:ADP-dependent glucokinase/phosphofructokinase [Cryobacterium algoricola]|nr:ADP-dependent glucokinase/phosphofructokinase [Cryobacterium algoricola]
MAHISMREKLVLGLGGTVDYEIAWDSRVIEHLIREYSIRASELDASIPVMSERDLVVTLLAFLAGGAGGERFVASSDIVETFAARFDRRITLGGTCVRAAMAMQALGVESTVHLVSIDDHVRRLLPAGCAYLCSADHDTTDPHLIVQFSAGARVQAGDIDLDAPHPNRVIYANDPPNERLLLSEGLGEALREAEIFLISGFNVIQDTDLLRERLLDIRQHMQQLPLDAVVYYEDAGFHVPAMSRYVRDALIGVIDVYSMNEDEMQAYLGRPVDLLAVDEVAEALRELQLLIPAATLVVHTKYWSLALGELAASYAASLQGGITMASTRYCYGDDFTERDYREIDSRVPSVLGTRFAADLEDRMGPTVRCLPAFALTVAAPTTIGLGDSFVGGFIAALARR